MEHLHKLGEDQYLVPFFHDIENHVLECFKFAGNHVGTETGHIHLEQFGVAADLAELEQGVQNGHLAFGHALFGHVGQYLFAQFARQSRVEFCLFLCQRAVGDTFDFGRQILDHFGLGTAQDKGLDARAQVFQRFGIPFLDWFDHAALEGVLGTEKTGHKKFKQAPQFKQVVFNGGTGKAELHARVDVAHRAGGNGVRVLDVLGFVQNNRVEIVLFQFFKIAAQQGVGGDDQIRVRYFAEDIFPPRAVDNNAGKIRDKFGRFTIPVGKHRGRHDNQVGPRSAVIDHMLDEGQGLDGFAQTHFVGENAAKAVFVEEVEVGNTLQLIGAQFCRQPLGHGHLFDFLEVADTFPQLAPEGILLGGGEILQQAVQHRGFILLELALGRFGRVKAEHLELVRQFFQPGFRQARVRTILELHITFALEPGFPDALQRKALAVVFHLNVQREPLVFLVAFDAGIDHG